MAQNFSSNLEHSNIVTFLQWLVDNKKLTKFQNNPPPITITSPLVTLEKTGSMVTFETCQELVFRITVLNPKYHTLVYYSTQYVWLFKSDIHISFEVILEQLRLYGHYKTWEYYVHIVSYIPKGEILPDDLYFYGIYADFKVYPATSNWQFMLNYGPLDTFALSVLFDTITSGVNRTHRNKIDHTMTRQTRKQCLFLILDNKYNYKTHFIVEKTKKIDLLVTNASCSKSEFYDGPGVLSDHTVLTKNMSYFRCTSFQCLVHTEFFASCKSPGSLYTSTETVLPQVRTIAIGQKLVDNFPIDTTLVTLKYKTSNRSHIQVKLLNFSFTGEEDPECLFGGIAFYDTRQNHILDEVDILCVEYFHHSRTVFSESSHLILVLYYFPQYAHISTQLEIDSISCQVVHVDICDKMSEEIQFKTSMTNILDRKSESKLASNFSAHISATASQCTVVLVFARSQQACKFEVIPFSVQVMLERKASTGFYEYHFQGILSSLSTILTPPKFGDSHFQVAGKDYFHSKGDDLNVLVLGHRNSRQNAQTVSTTKFHSFNLSYLQKSHRKVFEIVPFVTVLPSYSANIYFDMFVHAPTPTHRYSPVFRVSLYGRQSWVALYFAPSMKYFGRTRAILLSATPLSDNYVKTHHILYLVVSKNQVKYNKSELAVFLKTKVSACVSKIAISSCLTQ